MEGMLVLQVEENGVCGFDSYRVPGIAALSSGELLVTYEGRDEETGQRTLLMRRSRDGGRSFEPRIVLREPEGNELLHNPMLLARRSGEVWLFWCQDYTRLFVQKSMDGGVTLALPKR